MKGVVNTLYLIPIGPVRYSTWVYSIVAMATHELGNTLHELGNTLHELGNTLHELGNTLHELGNTFQVVDIPQVFDQIHCVLLQV